MWPIYRCVSITTNPEWNLVIHITLLSTVPFTSISCIALVKLGSTHPTNRFMITLQLCPQRMAGLAWSCYSIISCWQNLNFDVCRYCKRTQVYRIFESKWSGWDGFGCRPMTPCSGQPLGHYSIFLIIGFFQLPDICKELSICVACGGYSSKKNARLFNSQYTVEESKQGRTVSQHKHGHCVGHGVDVLGDFLFRTDKKLSFVHYTNTSLAMPGHSDHGDHK